MAAPRIDSAWISVLLMLLCLSVADAGPGAEVALEWDPPTNNVDGTKLTDLAGHRLHYGTASRAYTGVVEVGNVSRATVTGLAWATTYYFAAMAHAEGGEESAFSDELQWTSPDSPTESALAALDHDGDGQSDAWEDLHFGSTTAANADPDADPDGDRKTNLEEFIAGTDPGDARSVPALGLGLSGRAPVISIRLPGTDSAEYEGLRRYVTLEFAADPVHAPWAALPGFSSVPATNQLICCTDQVAVGARFYRALVRIE